MITTRVHRMGKETAPKQPPSPTKADYARYFGWQLYEALQVRATELRELDRQGLVAQKLTEPIQQFWNDVLAVHQTTTKIRGQIPKSLMNEIRHLHKTLGAFDAYLDANLQYHSAKDLLLGLSLAELLEDIRHFIRQMQMTYSSIAADGPNKRLPNRPTDWAKKKLFIQEVLAHQTIHGKFPPYKILEKAMARVGFELKQRTDGEWRAQHRRGELCQIIHNR